MQKVKHHSNILTKVIAVIAIAFSLCVGCFYTLPARADNAIVLPGGALNYDKTYVLDDLKAASVGENKLDLSKYTYDMNGTRTIQIISFTEYAYTFRKPEQANYGLYIYIYNPSANEIDVIGNSLQLSAGTDKVYSKYALTLLSKSTGNEQGNLFYKFKVADPDREILKDINAELSVQLNNGFNVNTATRTYDLSGIELNFYENSVKDYAIGGSYVYSGYAKGYGADISATSTLTSTIKEIETIELDLHDAYYRTNSSSLGKDHQNQLNSVYFAVGNEYFERYGRLQRILAEWNEYKTQPIVVTSDFDAYSAIKPYIAKNMGVYNKELIYSVTSKDYKMQGDMEVYTWAYNGHWQSSYGEGQLIAKTRTETLYSLIYTDNVFNPTRISDYIKTYNTSFTKGSFIVNGNKYSEDLFLDSVDSNRTRGYNKREFDADEVSDQFNLLSYDETHNGWDKFWDYFFKGITTDDTIKNLPPILQVDSLEGLTDNEIATMYLLSLDDAQAFKAYHAKSLAENKTPILFRFSNTDYYSFQLEMRKNGKVVKNNSYYAQQTVFLGFDIIQLTFNRDGMYTVIPVVASPIDIITDLTVPPTFEDNNGCKIKSYWWLIALIALVVVILVVVLFPKILVKIFKYFFIGLWYVITSPYRLAKLIVCKIRKV